MAYDTIVILKKHATINIQQKYVHTLFEKYFLRHAVFLKDINFKPTSIQNKIYLRFFQFKIKHQWFYNFWNGTLFYLAYAKFLLNRSWLFIFNKDYRTDIITDRKRVYREHRKKLFT
jgi:hypothetical protein